MLGVALTKGCTVQNLKLKSDAYCIICDTCLHCKRIFIEGRGVFTKLRWVFTLQSCLIPCILGRGQFLPSWLGPLSIGITFSFLQWGACIVCLYVFADSHVKNTSEGGIMVYSMDLTTKSLWFRGIYVTCVYIYICSVVLQLKVWQWFFVL